jgi:hypothetical protein
MEIIDLNKYLTKQARPDFEDECRRMSESGSPAESRIGGMMLALFDALRRGVVGPRLFASKLLPGHSELWLQYSSAYGRRTMITTMVDYQDYAPLVDGAPLMHYRLSYTRASDEPAAHVPPVELRTRDVGTAYEFIVEAINQCK